MQVDISQQDLLLFIINDGGCHWTLLVRYRSTVYNMGHCILNELLQVVDIKAQQAEYYDSLYKDNVLYWSHIK